VSHCLRSCVYEPLLEGRLVHRPGCRAARLARTRRMLAVLASFLVSAVLHEGLFWWALPGRKGGKSCVIGCWQLSRCQRAFHPGHCRSASHPQLTPAALQTRLDGSKLCWLPCAGTMLGGTPHTSCGSGSSCCGDPCWWLKTLGAELSGGGIVLKRGTAWDGMHHMQQTGERYETC
jgi:hypothetical protein